MKRIIYFICLTLFTSNSFSQELNNIEITLNNGRVRIGEIVDDIKYDYIKILKINGEKAIFKYDNIALIIKNGKTIYSKKYNLSEPLEIKLKNGIIINGTIASKSTYKNIEVIKNDGTKSVCLYNDIKSISQFGHEIKRTSFPWYNNMEKKGIGFSVEYGYLGNDKQSIKGTIFYKVLPQLSIGIGTGLLKIDNTNEKFTYNSHNIGKPIFGSVNFSLFDGKIKPFFNINMGTIFYEKTILHWETKYSEEKTEYRNKRTYYFNPSIGIQHNLHRDFGYYFSIGHGDISLISFNFGITI